MSWVLPIYVITTMLNVGLTQPPSAILGNLRNWHFLVRMLLANFVIVPALMFTFVRLADMPEAHAAALVIMGVCAGAPFLIKLTQTSDNDVALGATVMMVLMATTVVVAPILLPLLIDGLDVNATAVGTSLFLQMLLPIMFGMAIAAVAGSLADAVQPWIARIGNIALYVVLGGTMIGYWPEIRTLVSNPTVFGGMVVLLIAFVVGFLFGDGADHLKDVGGLGTAQRNTAATMIIATDNFTDPMVFVVVSVVNTLGIFMLLMIAKVLSRDDDEGDGHIFVGARAMNARRVIRTRQDAPTVNPASPADAS